MFKKLVNEAMIRFNLSVNGPLLINESPGSKVDPTLTDMSFVRCTHDGVNTVYLPGSSIKGVFRSRYEQLMTAFEGAKVCNILDMNRNSNEKTKSCSLQVKHSNGGKARYQRSCHACRLFGNLALGSRVTFTDAYPFNKTVPHLSIRHGVKIDRITGAGADKGLFDIEVVDSGTFALEIHLQNFELYQLYLLLWIIQDIDEGTVTLGMGGSRGNGQMRLLEQDKMMMRYRLFIKQNADKIRGYQDDDLGTEVKFEDKILFKECTKKGLGDIIKVLGITSNDQLIQAIKRPIK